MNAHVEEVTMCITDSGRLFEATLLGHCGSQGQGYIPWKEAARLVRGHQPREMRPTPARLLAEVQRLVGRLAEVRFCTAVGSTLDTFHSVDAFFEIPACGLMVTIDVTLNSQKTSARADLVLHAEDFEDLPALAVRVARLFAEKARARREHRAAA